MRYSSPLKLAAAAMAASLGGALVVLILALGQPSLAIDLAVPRQGEGLVVRGVDQPDLAPLVGARVVGIGAPGGARVPVDGGTLIEEPDKLNDAALIRAFRANQDRIRALLSDEAVVLYWLGAGEAGETVVPVQPARPLADLPLGFWAQLVTGLAGAMIGGWIWALNPGRASHVLLFLTGIGLQVSASSAALYSGRELALSARAYEVLAPVNAGGALLFGAGLVGLFLRYPRQLAPAWISWLPLPLLFAPLSWAIATGGGNPVLFLHVPIVVALVAILSLLVVQWVVARRDPLSRAALRLVALGIVTGAGGFVLTTTLPALLGVNSQVSQAMSFPLFLLVFAGVALAVRRYRFFDLDRWSFSLLFYIGGAVVLLLLDAFLVFTLSLDRQPALGVALLVVTLGYLPLRERLARLVLPGGRQELPLASLVRAADRIALTRDAERQAALWGDLLGREFAALAVEPARPAARTEARVEEEGAALFVPSVPPLPALRLRWRDRGRRLFSSGDAQKAQDIVAILTQMVEARLAFVAGMNEERERIARDVHDNIGMRLTSALGQSDVANKNDLIRETFTDIRRILSQDDGGAAPLDEILADLRVELTDYLDAQGIAFDWPLPEAGDARLSPGIAHALRSLLRESVHNAARHSGADRVAVETRVGPAGFRVAIGDSGAGGNPGGASRVQSLVDGGGTGLANLRRRIADVGGRMTVTALPGRGFRIEAEMPFTARPAAAAGVADGG